jgi:hypothetical protein
MAWCSLSARVVSDGATVMANKPTRDATTRDIALPQHNKRHPRWWAQCYRENKPTTERNLAWKTTAKPIACGMRQEDGLALWWRWRSSRRPHLMVWRMSRGAWPHLVVTTKEQTTAKEQWRTRVLWGPWHERMAPSLPWSLPTPLLFSLSLSFSSLFDAPKGVLWVMFLETNTLELTFYWRRRSYHWL